MLNRLENIFKELLKSVIDYIRLKIYLEKYSKDIVWYKISYEEISHCV